MYGLVGDQTNRCRRRCRCRCRCRFCFCFCFRFRHTTVDRDVYLSASVRRASVLRIDSFCVHYCYLSFVLRYDADVGRNFYCFPAAPSFCGSASVICAYFSVHGQLGFYIRVYCATHATRATRATRAIRGIYSCFLTQPPWNLHHN
jgi:hypothetical protein